MKCLLIPILTVLATSTIGHAEGNSGGGGNGPSAQRAWEQDIRQAINAQKFFFPLVYKAVKEDAREGRDCWGDDQFCPVKLMAEMNQFPNDEKFVKSLHFRQQMEPCDDNGTPADSSAIPPRTICFSIERLLKREYSPNEVLKQITALSMHETAHLMGNKNDRHTEIGQLQVVTSDLVGEVGATEMLSAFAKLRDNMSVGFAIGNLAANLDGTIEGLCAAVGITGQTIAEISSFIDELEKIFRVEYAIGKEAKYFLVEAISRIINVQVNGCGMKANDPVFASVSRLFAEKAQVSVYDINFAVNHAFTGISERDFLENECGQSFDCESDKKIVLEKIKPRNLKQISTELERAVEAYSKYYKIVRKLAKKADRRQDRLNN